MDTTEYIVNRLEVIDHTKDGEGRAYVKWVDYDFEVGFSQQDEGRTLKIFLNTSKSNNKLSTKIKDALDTYYAPIKLPESNREGLVNTLTAIILEELKTMWNATQPDTVPEGWEPETEEGKYLLKRIREYEKL